MENEKSVPEIQVDLSLKNLLDQIAESSDRVLQACREDNNDGRVQEKELVIECFSNIERICEEIKTNPANEKEKIQNIMAELNRIREAIMAGKIGSRSLVADQYLLTEGRINRWLKDNSK